MCCKTGIAGGLLAVAVAAAVGVFVANGQGPATAAPTTAPVARVDAAGDAVSMTDWRETGDQGRRNGIGRRPSSVVP